MAVAVAAAWLLLKPVSTARSTLLIASSQPKILFATAENTANRDDATNYQRTQAALVKSRVVRMSALRKPLVSELTMLQDKTDVLEWLENNINVDLAVGPEILRVSLNGDKPKELVILLNAIIDAYLQEIVHNEKHKREDRLQQMKKINADFEADLKIKRRELQDLAEIAGSGDMKTLALKHQFVLEQLSIVRKELLQCRTEISRMVAGVKRPMGSAQAGLPDFLPVDAARDPIVAKLVQEEARISASIKRAKSVMIDAENQPRYKSLLEELENNRQNLANRRNEVATAMRDENKARLETFLKNKKLAKEEELAAYNKWQDLLNEEVAGLTKEAQSINRFSLDIISMREAIAQIESVTLKIGSEVKSLEVEVQAPPRVTLLEDAGIVGNNSARRRYLGMGAGALGSLLFVLFGVAWFDLRGRRISSQDDLQGLGIRLVGLIPKCGKQQHLLTRREHADANADQLIFNSSLDSTRTMLLQAAQAQIVLITSALSGEGKTSIACHLAASLAYSGRRVLLLDCDMHKPSVHRVLNVHPAPGFSSLLLGAATIEEVVQPTSVPGLFVIPAGAREHDASQALAQDGVVAIFDSLRERYDCIVVDSCPILPVVDSLLIAPHVDAVVFSILNDVSRMPAVRAAWEKLQALGAPMLGGIVNGVEQESYGYSSLYG
jgi:capsular exopolysaccharide synthesis family protein